MKTKIKMHNLFGLNDSLTLQEKNDWSNFTTNRKVSAFKWTMICSAIALMLNIWELHAQDVENTLVVTDTVRTDTTGKQILGDKPEINQKGDTTHIKLGKKGITIVEKNGKTIVNIENADEKDSTSKKNESDDNAKNDDSYKWERKKFSPHWGGLDLVLNNFITSDLSLNLPASSSFLELNTTKSLGVRINLFEYGIPVTPYQGFVTGLGFEINSYYFNSDSNNITKRDGQIVAKVKPAGSSDYWKNKLKDTYLTLPLMYEIQFPLGNADKPLYFSAGLIGGLKIGSRTKEYYRLNGETRHEIIKDDFYLSPFRLGYQARIGFRQIHLVATYYQTPLFLKGKGPEVHPFDIGLMLLNW